MPQSFVPLHFRRLDDLHGKTMTLIDKTNLYRQNQEQMAMRTYAPGVSNFHTVQMHRLFTRLYHIAALLMLHRAEHDGDMEPQQVARESAKIMAEPVLSESDHPSWDEIEEAFCHLHRQSLELAWQTKHLIEIKIAVQERKDKPANMLPNRIHCQLRQIEQAFGANGVEKI